MDIQSAAFESIEPVVWRFLSDNYIVDMAFAKAGGSNADKSRLFSKLFNCLATRIAHANLQAPHKLRYAR